MTRCRTRLDTAVYAIKHVGIIAWLRWIVFPNCIYTATHNVHYRQVSNISRTWEDNEIVDHSDVVGASPVGAAPTTSSFSPEQLPSLYCAKTTTSRVDKYLSFWNWCVLYCRFDGLLDIPQEIHIIWIPTDVKMLSFIHCNICEQWHPM